MFDFNNTELQITREEILSRISEYDIFKRYCSNFIDIDKSFCSDLRKDSNPDCRIHINYNNELRYKDFAAGDYLDCWKYVMAKFNCNYYEALSIIANDFNIRNIKINIDPSLVIGKEIKVEKPIIKVKSNITIVEQPFNLIDHDYWGQFGISLDVLQEYNVFAAKYVYLLKGDKRHVFEYTKNNPCYAYRFTRDGAYTYKIYWPLTKDKKFKWLFSGGASEDVEGLDQLPLYGDLLILTKSLKDCMCYKVLGYSAISLQGEANKLDNDLVNKLLKRFNKIVVNYDNDEQGIKSTLGLNQQYRFDYFYIDKHKDLSDYIKSEGLNKAKKMLKMKLNGVL